jgi:hypothetical protein
MTFTRGKWLQSLLAALAVIVGPGSTSTLWAQGYGADPFRNPFDQYTYPRGATALGEAQRGGFQAGMGTRAANQFQGYLDELSGAGRQSTERYGIGVPYYRSAVDPSFDPKGKREYQPNREADRTYEQSQELITRKYLAYFAERDPKKRAQLLRDYDRARDQVARALSAHRTNSSQILEAATGADLDRRRSPSTTRGAGVLPATADRTPRSSSSRPVARDLATDGSRGRRTGPNPPPPPLFREDSLRRNTSRRSPSEVLDRSRRINSVDELEPGATRRSGLDSGTARQPRIAAPSPD